MTELRHSLPNKDFSFGHWREIPLVGLDRNQPLRRYLSKTGQHLSTRHLDPGVVYHWPGKTVVRGSSVETWIETCAEIFPGEGMRDFWELVWNLSVYVWDFIDKLGREPWRKPNPGFPLVNPSFWRGARRTRLLFAESRSFINQFSMKDKSAFLAWIEQIVRFQYGATLDSIPMGMVALALNAPSESYLLEINPVESPFQPEPADCHGAWRIPFTVGKGWADSGCPVHQLFFDTALEGLSAQTVVFVTSSVQGGHLYLRARPDGSLPPEALSNALENHFGNCLGQEWGSAAWTQAMKVASYPFPPGLPVEREWPWLGCARALLLHNKGDRLSTN